VQVYARILEMHSNGFEALDESMANCRSGCTGTFHTNIRL
jgi:hypothetical protein